MKNLKNVFIYLQIVLIGMDNKILVLYGINARDMVLLAYPCIQSLPRVHAIINNLQTIQK